MRFIKLTLITIFVGITGLVQAEEGGWVVGVGTGIFGLNIEGDTGYGTIAGPAVIELDVDFQDILDVKDTAAGIALFATKGKWTYDFSFGVMKLSGENEGLTADGTAFAIENSFDATAGNLGVSYAWIQDGTNTLQISGGLRYSKQKIGVELLFGPASAARNISENWTDGYVGLAYTRQLAPGWSWNSKVNIGAGGSDLSTLFNTGIAWHFSPHWVTSLYGNYYSVDYETGDENDLDYFLYDADEFGIGLGIAYLWF